MTRRTGALRGLALGVVVAGAAVGLAACGSSSSSSTTEGGGGGGTTQAGSSTVPSKAMKGGTYRTALTDFGFTDNFDPSGEYLGLAWGYHSNLLTRTLLTYRHIAGAAGNELVPDLATSLPTKNGNTYTFHLKSGIKFGPPVNREITSQDIKYAIERIGTPSVAAQYPNYYQPIAGFDAFAAGKAKTITGIKTPNSKTISFTLAKPVGDFLFSMAMPASGPIPKEVAKCFTQAGAYGRYVIASGPYMIAGSPQLNIKSCSTMKPISGYDPSKHLNFVRNPNYDPKTDNVADRESNPDSFTVAIDTNLDDIFAKINAGQLDGSPQDVPTKYARQYSQSENLKPRLQVNSGDRTQYIFMNLTEPPFDDIHVRKAVNLVMDKDGLRRAWGGPIYGQFLGHIVPNNLYGNDPSIASYDPYGTEGQAGDATKAKAEMKQSKYDKNKDGICDASQCKGLILINRNYGNYAAMTPVIESSLNKIGIGVNVRQLPTSPAYTTIQTVARHIPIGSNAGWGKDYADPSTFMVLMDGRNIKATGNSNYSLVGLTKANATKFKATYPSGGVPNVDADIDKCVPLTGQERTNCWIALDKKLMTTVVPWVPYLDVANTDLLSAAVTKYAYDQFSGETGFAHVAVDPSKQK
jgi:peptide/nickel transport system substrate-binding protein